MEFSKHKNYRNSKYLNWLRSQPCLVSGEKGECAHHVRLGTNGGKGLKPSDYFCIPLLMEYHTAGKNALHMIGEQTFFRRYNIDINKVFISLLQSFLKDQYHFKLMRSEGDCQKIIYDLTIEIEMRRPPESLTKKAKKIKIHQMDKCKETKGKRFSESEYYRKGLESKRLREREYRKVIKEEKKINFNKDLSTKDTEYAERSKILRRKLDKENRDKYKEQISIARKESYRLGKLLKSETSRDSLI